MSQKLRVNIVGIGPGNPDLLTGEARQAIAASNILLGDKRMLSAFADSSKTVYDTIKTSAIAEVAAKADPAKDVLAVLVSGDVGFFSLAKTISGKLPDCECVRYCGISSLVYFASKLQLSWDDAKIVSMHGRDQNLVAAVAQNKKVFSLTGGEHSPQALCKQLCEHGLGQVLVYVGENLSYPEEKITQGTAEEISALSFPSLSVMMLLNDEANCFEPTVHGLADDLFMRSKVPMTKQEVRSVSMSKLMPKATDVIYDIGAGTGSCSVELALIAKQGKVWAFERNPVAVELLGKNKELFGLTNLDVIAGEALENIKTMPAPDCVFVGGSGGDLCEMLDVIYAKNSKCRIVINAITVETLAQVAAYYKEHPDYSLEIVNVFVARSKKLGSYNLMMAQNPVYVMTALKKED
ncbi:precorrin-6y C5,15-methyltransferase (decarboxylating) subunit CbiE [Phascolarctobacterium succinatutens]|uniref:precorrin-6y C5,15-methyltransferase (decarboxylating) subunit CbiE n=1 Tax=Phascolarctobacterium succinatutens TaxID=626940 RepID=UPI0026EFE4FA|nr:precorrin-6y C5,15-methyltransferase (decarboxylating) subunit CbiE [Phascolarctobacterium succinatutens]